MRFETPLLPGNAHFTDAHKAIILKGKMTGKYFPVPVQFPPGTDLDTPARFLIWLEAKYQEENMGIAAIALRTLLQEKFDPSADDPEKYEKRIRPLLPGLQPDT